jgi:hypothetical protein
MTAKAGSCSAAISTGSSTTVSSRSTVPAPSTSRTRSGSIRRTVIFTETRWGSRSARSRRPGSSCTGTNGDPSPQDCALSDQIRVHVGDEQFPGYEALRTAGRLRRQAVEKTAQYCRQVLGRIPFCVEPLEYSFPLRRMLGVRICGVVGVTRPHQFNGGDLLRRQQQPHSNDGSSGTAHRPDLDRRPVSGLSVLGRVVAQCLLQVGRTSSASSGDSAQPGVRGQRCFR